MWWVEAMRGRVEVGRVAARLLVWFLLLLAGTTTDLSSLASLSPVIFPSEAALRVHLPEWRPRDREQRAAEPQWKHGQRRNIQFDLHRRGEDCHSFYNFTMCWCKM